MLPHLICIILFAGCMNGLTYRIENSKSFKFFNKCERRGNMAIFSRKRNTNSPTAKGFKTTVIPSPDKDKVDVQTSIEPEKPAELKSISEVQNEQDIFKKYGISDGEKSDVRKGKGSNKKKKVIRKDTEELPPFGEEVMANMPMEVQQKFDNFLIAATFSSLTFVVLCGIGISLGAFKVAFPQINIPPGVDSLITNVFTPAFTPALGIFFLFSITFGLFKFAQISSSQTVYRED